MWKNPPAVRGLHWRPATGADALALTALQDASHGVPLSAYERTPFVRLLASSDALNLTALCGIDASGRISAFVTAAVYSTEEEHRGDLDVLVHPNLREWDDVEGRLLHWTEAQARLVLAELPDDRPSILRIAYTDQRPHATHCYERAGFRFAFAADTMRRDLSEPIPTVHVPAGLVLSSWTEPYMHQAHRIYAEAFGDRSDYRGWDEQQWRGNLIESPWFRPDVPGLLLDGTAPAAYLICWVHSGEHGEGNVGTTVQLGVRPRYRRQGLGWILMLAALHGFRRLDLRYALLEVNADNERARQLHQKLGFIEVARLTVLTMGM